MDVEGKPGVFLEVPGLGQTVLVIFHQEGEGIPRKQEEGGALQAGFGKIFFKFTGIGLKIKNDVQHSPENRKKHDNKNPGKLICGLFPLVDDMHAHNDAHHVQRPAHIPGIAAAAGQEVQYNRYLYQQDDDNKNPSSEHNPEPFFFFHLTTPLPR
jgi:hypothetical protein